MICPLINCFYKNDNTHNNKHLLSTHFEDLSLEE